MAREQTPSIVWVMYSSPRSEILRGMILNVNILKPSILGRVIR